MSPNTERVYAGRVALYLNYCLMRRLDWKAPGFLGLAGLQQSLVETPQSHTCRPATVFWDTSDTPRAWCC